MGPGQEWRANNTNAKSSSVSVNQSLKLWHPRALLKSDLVGNAENILRRSVLLQKYTRRQTPPVPDARFRPQIKFQDHFVKNTSFAKGIPFLSKLSSKRGNYLLTFTPPVAGDILVRRYDFHLILNCCTICNKLFPFLWSLDWRSWQYRSFFFSENEFRLHLFWFYRHTFFHDLDCFKIGVKRELWFQMPQRRNQSL